MRQALGIGAILAIILVLAMITGFQPLYWLLYLVGAGAIAGYLWTWVQSRGLDTSVDELSLHPQVGHEAHLRVSVREKIGLPRVGLRARLVSDLATVEEEDLNLAPRGTSTWDVSGVCRRRGLNNIGSLAIVSNDPAGLFTLESHVGKPQSVLVYPATLDLIRAVVEGQSTGGEIGEMGQFTGASPVASMVRQYNPGDSLARIHWPTTARLNQLMTKEFEGAGINDLWLFVDMDQASQAGSGEESTEEYSITIAASLARSLIGSGHSVGLVAQGDETYRILPGRQEGHLWGLLRGMALVSARGNVPLLDLMTRESSNLGAGTVVIVIAPWPGRAIGNLFRFLTRRGILVVPIFMDTASFSRTPDSHWLRDDRVEAGEWTIAIRRGDDLAIPLGNVLNMIASY